MRDMLVATMRDQAVRVTLGIPAKVAARLAGVGRETLTRYEIDPLAVHSETKRAACAKVYERFRGLLGESNAAPEWHAA